MNAIVPAGTNLARVYSGVKRARTTSGYVRRYGPAAYRAARTIARAYRRRRGAKRAPGRRVIPGRQGKTRAKATMMNDLAFYPIRTLKFTPMLFGGIGDNFGERTGHTIQMCGFKYCFEFQNWQQVPLVVHFAIIQARDTIDYQEIETTYDWKKDFFRDYENAANKSTDFVDTTDPGGYDWRYECYKINPTKYSILTHRKKTLIGRQQVSGSENDYHAEAQSGRLHWRWKIDKYMKCKKHLAFDTKASTTPNKPIMFVWWCNTLNNDDWATLATSRTSACEYAHMVKPVWKNALN